MHLVARSVPQLEGCANPDGSHAIAEGRSGKNYFLLDEVVKVNAVRLE